jgi:hypothetical protein
VTSPFILGLNKALPSPQKVPVRQSLPSTALAPVSSKMGSGKKPYNPFLTALNTDSEEFRESYGVNRPFKEPAFFGYHHGRELKGGQRLFMLY